MHAVSHVRARYQLVDVDELTDRLSSAEMERMRLWRESAPKLRRAGSDAERELIGIAQALKLHPERVAKRLAVDGWAPIPPCLRAALDAAVEAGRIAPTKIVRARRVSSVLGILLAPASRLADDYARDAEGWSASTCEACGAPGGLRKSGRLLPRRVTRCDACAPLESELIDAPPWIWRTDLQRDHAMPR